METKFRTTNWTTSNADREYHRTHPWITFQLDLKRAPIELWLLLGEAQSKCEHIKGIPLLPDIAEMLHVVSLAKGVRATTAIEGNTLSEQQVIQRMKGELQLPLSQEYLGIEVDNILNACNHIGNRILGGEPADLCIEDVKTYNKLVLSNLPLDPDVIPGEIRGNFVGVGNYRAAPPQDCEYLLNRLCEFLNEEFEAPQEYKMAFGILKAIFAHLYIAWIHPFGDGNGRTARLVELQIMLSLGIPSTAAHLLSNHYNNTRTKYYQQLDQASGSGGNILPFIQYALQGFVDGLREQIETIKTQQIHVHWINHIHEQFKNRDKKATDRRKRQLALALSNNVAPVPVSEIRYISGKVAEAYANKTDKTIQRDIDDLVEMELVRKTRKSVEINWSKMLAFLPPSRGA